jgi:hypothetical protein
MAIGNAMWMDDDDVNEIVFFEHYQNDIRCPNGFDWNIQDGMCSRLALLLTQDTDAIT